MAGGLAAAGVDSVAGAASPGWCESSSDDQTACWLSTGMLLWMEGTCVSAMPPRAMRSWPCQTPRLGRDRGREQESQGRRRPPPHRHPGPPTARAEGASLRRTRRYSAGTCPSWAVRDDRAPPGGPSGSWSSGASGPEVRFQSPHRTLPGPNTPHMRQNGWPTSQHPRAAVHRGIKQLKGAPPRCAAAAPPGTSGAESSHSAGVALRRRCGWRARPCG